MRAYEILSNATATREREVHRDSNGGGGEQEARGRALARQRAPPPTSTKSTCPTPPRFTAGRADGFEQMKEEAEADEEMGPDEAADRRGRSVVLPRSTTARGTTPPFRASVLRAEEQVAALVSQKRELRRGAAAVATPSAHAASVISTPVCSSSARSPRPVAQIVATRIARKDGHDGDAGADDHLRADCDELGGAGGGEGSRIWPVEDDKEIPSLVTTDPKEGGDVSPIPTPPGSPSLAIEMRPSITTPPMHTPLHAPVRVPTPVASKGLDESLQARLAALDRSMKKFAGEMEVPAGAEEAAPARPHRRASMPELESAAPAQPHRRASTGRNAEAVALRERIAALTSQIAELEEDEYEGDVL
mmetsp:Transcript_40528/g.127760  ORF Transcript_40528/g.127760 Transcript_40528/m.127760 type:complete len:362 (+) Transcript_40528:543-1628(+)